jgi:drug/metabolite transporter (DMT)-like permease
MKPLSLLGVVLLVCGIAALAYQGITYKSRDTVLDVGPLHATAVREHTIPLSPLFGIVAVVGGAALLVMGSRKNA